MVRFLLIVLLTIILLSICLLIFSRTSYIWSLNQSRRRGFIGRRPTIEDVKNLLHKGERTAAIDAYRRIYRLSNRQAELEVDLLERNLQKNK